MKLVASLLLWKNSLVNKYQFSDFRPIGKVLQTTQRLEEIQIDEIMLLNKSHSSDPADDFLGIQEREPALKQLLTPISYGGGLNTIEQVERIIHSGAERVVLSPKGVASGLAHEISDKFGEQALVYHLPFRFSSKNLYLRTSSGLLSGKEVLARIPSNFGGEIIMTSMSSEGTKEIDFEELERLIDLLPSEVVKVYSGGVANVDQLFKLSKMGLNGVCLGNVLNTKEIFVLTAKKSCSAITRPVQKK